MAKRVTVSLDDSIVKKIRIRQAKLISQKHRSYSFSKVLNEILRVGLK